MPYINARITSSVSTEKQEAIKTLLGGAIEAIPGKSEAWLMVEICPECNIWFRGDNSAPSAYIEIKIFGEATDSACEAMTATVCGIFERELSIPADRIYVKYEFCRVWGWNGANF